MPARNWLQALLFCWTTLCRIIWPCVPYSSRRPADEDLKIDLSLACSATCFRTRSVGACVVPAIVRANPWNGKSAGLKAASSDRARISLKNRWSYVMWTRVNSTWISSRRIICRTIRATGRSHGVQMQRWFSSGMRFFSKRKPATK